MDPVQLHSLQNCQSIWLGFGGVFLGVELAVFLGVFLGVDLGVFLGVFLCVDLSSAVGVLVTSSQIGPFNAPCYRPNIPTCDFAQNTSQKHPRRNNTNQKRHWLQPLWTSYIQPAGRVKWNLQDLGWFGSKVQLAWPLPAGLRPDWGRRWKLTGADTIIYYRSARYTLTCFC